MKKVLMLLAATALLASCSGEKQNEENNQEVTPVEEAQVEPEVAPAPELDVYVAKDDAAFRLNILEQDENGENITFFNLSDDTKVYKMKLVQSASGSKYEDKDGNFLWFKGDDFYFGKGEDILKEGTKQTLPAEEQQALKDQRAKLLQPAEPANK